MRCFTKYNLLIFWPSTRIPTTTIRPTATYVVLALSWETSIGETDAKSHNDLYLSSHIQHCCASPMPSIEQSRSTSNNLRNQEVVPWELLVDGTSIVLLFDLFRRMGKYPWRLPRSPEYRTDDSTPHPLCVAPLSLRSSCVGLLGEFFLLMLCSQTFHFALHFVKSCANLVVGSPFATACCAISELLECCF